MDHHVKKLMYAVRVGEPDPGFGNTLEQLGGADGELAADQLLNQVAQTLMSAAKMPASAE